MKAWFNQKEGKIMSRVVEVMSGSLALPSNLSPSFF